ncbi:hypothetical protein HWV62_14162 [Athelia sp. TMB]|nr:hypothetical protein HWV62_14162 [Athelia sp. TMB]
MMARSISGSPSLSPRSASPAFSSSPSSSAAELEDEPTPSTSTDKSAKNAEPDAVTCLWDDCGVIFTHLPTLITHIHDEHIGVHKSNYTCEWATCARRGLAQTSRFALISHIRSHTGEKPFTCPRPECDKSFTRSDALAKHMRLQHGIEPPLPGRGGNRKRKRNHHYNSTFAGFPAPPADSKGEAGAAAAANGFSTFKVESSTPVEFYIEEGDGRRVISPIEHVRVDYFPASASASHAAPANATPPPARPSSVPPQPPSQAPEPASSESDDDAGDRQRYGGRPKAMVRYLRTKAKHRYALQEHEGLLEELRVATAELARERAEKELVLDEFLRAGFGPAADPLIVRIPQPESRRRRTAMK